jgi:phosphatidylserine/phosphatidylglycerophosphate/cardiolipin synthase-like enzyme
MHDDPYAALAEFLTASEAEALATQFANGERLNSALAEVAMSRRPSIKSLFLDSQLGHDNVAVTIAVLKSIWGAKSTPKNVVPVWTMPGNAASVGHLTSEFHRLVTAARVAVTAATYNFQDTSQMWTALALVSAQPDIVVTLYVDGAVADGPKVKAQIPRATVYQSKTLPNGNHARSHAKFVVIDHELVLLTSANFSMAAEQYNIEFGALIKDAPFAESIEFSMTKQHGSLYELVG